jgi:hypothetical protein
MEELKCRRAVWNDIELVNKLIHGNEHLVSSLVRRFGDFSLPYLLNSSVYSFVVEDKQGQVYGFASFLDSPPPGLADGVLVDDKWPTWFSETFTAPQFGVTNSLWLSFFVCAPDFENDVSDKVLHTVFHGCASLQSLLVLIPQDAPVDPHIQAMFEELPVDVPDYYGPRVYICPRSFFIPNMILRKAAIEDHDDLVPIFNNQSQVLTSIYGEFFLASIIESQDSNTQSLVAEVNNRAIGLMSITKQMDITLIRESFDLEVYDRLEKPVFTADPNQGKEIKVAEEEEESLEAQYQSPDQRWRAIFAKLCSRRTDKKETDKIPDTDFSSLLETYLESAEVSGQPNDYIHKVNDAIDSLFHRLNGSLVDFSAFKVHMMGIVNATTPSELFKLLRYFEIHTAIDYDGPDRPEHARQPKATALSRYNVDDSVVILFVNVNILLCDLNEGRCFCSIKSSKR